MKYYIHGSSKFSPKVYASSQKHVHTSQIQEVHLGQNSNADLHVHVLILSSLYMSTPYLGYKAFQTKIKR